MQLSQPKLGLHKQILTHGLGNLTAASENYFEYMLDFVELFGVSREQASAELNETLDLEIELAQVFETFKMKNLKQIIYFLIFSDLSF